MSEVRAWSGAPRRVGLVVALLAAVTGGYASAASAASAPPPIPGSTTNCGGSLRLGKATADDPNQMDYKFNCDYAISAYTLIVSRGLNTDSTVDDFSGGTVADSAGNPVTAGKPATTEAFNCGGTIPGGGVNCGDAGVALTAPDFVSGTFDTTDPYCSNIPAGSPAGTKPEASAVVQLVVTDTTGAEDGPFRLRLTGTKCPTVHVVKPKPKPKSKSKHSSKQHKAATKSSTR